MYFSLYKFPKLCYYANTITKNEGNMLTSKALTKQLTATHCSTTNMLFIHKSNVPAHKVYANNSKKIIRNLNAQQQKAFAQLPNTVAQKIKRYSFASIKHLQKMFA